MRCAGVRTQPARRHCIAVREEYRREAGYGNEATAFLLTVQTLSCIIRDYSRRAERPC